LVKYLLIRDDDVSYFTKPQTLEKLYGPLLNEKKPINFAVIPKINCNITVDQENPYRKKEHLEYDPIIPPKYRGREEDFQVDENSDITEFIQSFEKYEVLQHGFTHGLVNGVKEFRIKNKEILKQRAEAGRDILQKCFRLTPSFFVAPWDNVSLEAFNFIESSYKGLSMGRINPTRLPSKSWASYLQKMLSSTNYVFYKSLLIVEHSGYLLTRFNEPNSILNKVKKIIESQDISILVNHHWEYFYDWNGLDSSFFNAWKEVVEFVLQKEDLKIITFTELNNHIKARTN